MWHKILSISLCQTTSPRAGPRGADRSENQSHHFRPHPDRTPHTLHGNPQETQWMPGLWSVGANLLEARRGWLTDRGSHARRRYVEFSGKVHVVFDAELKRCRQAPYPGLTFGVAVAVQHEPQRPKHETNVHVVQLICSTSRKSFNPRRALFEQPSSNDGFNIWSMRLSVKGLAQFAYGPQYVSVCLPARDALDRPQIHAHDWSDGTQQGHPISLPLTIHSVAEPIRRR